MDQARIYKLEIIGQKEKGRSLRPFSFLLLF